MALQLAVQKFGVTFPLAYARIVRAYEGDGEFQGFMRADIEIHASAAQRQEGAEPLESFTLNYPFTNKAVELYPWVYNQIKSDGYFANAVDV